jgi:4-amino-4-deoxy-L-arabinose transferase and related glycosyltransferases of PMT family
MMMPRTWRIGAPTIATAALLAAVVLVALALRFAGLSWGRPFDYHPDEWAVANPAIDMVRTGSWDPKLYAYPSFLIYIERIIVAILHQADPAVSLATAPSGVVLPEQFPYIYAGRAFVALTGALVALPTYLAARAISNAAGGIAAAVAIAVAPIAVVNAHFLTTDVPTAALTALTLWLSLRGIVGGRRWLVAAAFAAGLAASTKYNGGLVVIVPLVVWLTSCPPRQLLRRRSVTTASLIVLASMAGFALLTPSILFATSQVWARGILFTYQTYSGAFPGASGSDGWVYFLQVLWGGAGFGPGLSILAGVGLLIAIAQHRRGDLAVLSFVFAYYLLLSLPPVRFDRNLLPMMPFLAVLAGRTVGLLVDALAAVPPRLTHLRRIPAFAVGLAVVAVAATPSVSSAIAYDQLLRTPDTRTIALDWIERNIPRGAAVAREWSTPQVPDSAYKVTFVFTLAIKPLESYRSAGIDYVVTSSSQINRFQGDSPQGAFYRALLAEPIVLDLRPKPGQQGPRVVVVSLSAVRAGGP